MVSFSSRLREERKKLHLTQAELAEKAGVTKKAQGDYEKERQPQFAGYLEALAREGLDVAYILTGDRGGAVLTPEEKELLRLDRGASLPGKAAAIAALTAGGQPGAPRQSVTIGGSNNGYIVGESLTIHETDKNSR